MTQVNRPIQTTKNDMPKDGWIDRFMPPATRPYLKLLRLDRPIGTWLLLLPCWWSTAMAGGLSPDVTTTQIITMMVLFAIGAIIMRGAGCIINDLADRNFDGQVERTTTRPLPSGQVKVWQALLFLAVIMLLGLAVLVQFRVEAFIVGVCSIPIIITYPFMKRITYWPQACLGLAFNWGALVGWAAVTGTVAPAAIAMYFAGFFWTLGYDTIYAHQDKDDDAKIGLKSLALRLGDATPKWTQGFYLMTTLLLGISGMLAGMHWSYYALLGLAGVHLGWQVATVKLDDAANCLKRFKSNRDYGLLVLAAIVIANLISTPT
ncbi:4-hydroxybenzoate octaprenyltransferase [Thalassospira sp. MA62]|nr:4-hydroxybenzoate octaprenyltransferase [Thalassospira sp. MA62]